MSLTQYHTAKTLDGFIADPDNSLEWLVTREREEDGPLNYGDFIAEVGAMAMGSTTYEWIIEHEFADEDPAEWKWPYDIPNRPGRLVSVEVVEARFAAQLLCEERCADAVWCRADEYVTGPPAGNAR